MIKATKYRAFEGTEFEDREWAQPYYAMNPLKGQKQLNKDEK